MLAFFLCQHFDHFEGVDKGVFWLVNFWAICFTFGRDGES